MTNNTSQLAENILTATQIALNALAIAQMASSIILKAQREGRDVSNEEMAQMRVADDVARATLEAQIKAAESKA